MADQPKRDELNGLLMQAREEIAALRQQVARLWPKAEAYDHIATILKLLPKQGTPMGEDVLWKIDKHFEQLATPAQEKK